MASTDASAADPRPSPGGAAEEPERASRRTWLATVVLLIAAFMELMDVTMIQAGSAAGVALLGVILFGLLASNSASERALPQLRQDLVAAGVANDTADSITTGVRDCLHDRTQANDPSSNPPACKKAFAPGQSAQTQAAIARADTALGRDDFARSMEDTLYWGAGVFALAGLLVFLIPGRRDAPGAQGSPAPAGGKKQGAAQEA